MKRHLLSLFILTSSLFTLQSSAEDGHQLWLRYQPVNRTKVVCNQQSPTIDIARQELETYYKDGTITLRIDPTMSDDEDCSTEPMPCFAARTRSHTPSSPFVC